VLPAKPRPAENSSAVFPLTRHSASRRDHVSELVMHARVALSAPLARTLLAHRIHKLAADVELATPERERWIVQTESFYDARGRVYLEQADATLAEAERGMAMLKKLVG
jgi:hypothetical protein